MLLNLSEQTGEALHAQISRQVRARILARELGGGELLPSIRALAREYRVSVITVQRAYEDLEREGLLHSHPGKGFYVAEHPEQTTRTIATRRFAAALANLVARSRAEGLDERRAIFYSTHVLSDIARLADELVFLRDGRVLQRSVKDELVEAWRRVTVSVLLTCELPACHPSTRISST